MAFNFTSYGDYFRSSQNPVCRIYGPTGATGSGATGATGPVGPAGNNGISTGLIYYFHAQGPSGQPGPGYTGFVMNTSIRDGPVGGNPIYPQYNGYFSNTQPTAGTTGPVLLGRYQTSSGDPGVTLIPPGSWSFVTNIYTGIDQPVGGATGLTGTTGSYINVYAEVWKTSQGISSLIGTNKDRAIEVKSAVDDSPYIMGVNIKSPGETLFTPTVDSMFVNFYAVPSTSTFVANQRIEFWTDGDSLSQVTTTLPAKSGNSGPTGPMGPSGPQGLPGKDGTGSQGIQGPMGESTWTPVTVPPTSVRIGPASGTFTKIQGLVLGYDTAIRSAQSYPGCYVSFNSPTTAGSEATFGISSIPNPLGNTGVDVRDIQYGINYNASGTTFGWYESGTSVTVPGGCVPGDSFSIIYDGTTVRYYHQNTLVRSVARAAGQTGAFHLEGNFLNYGSINNLVFGPAGQSSQFSGDVLASPGPTGTYGPLFYNRTLNSNYTGGPWFWSYRLRDIPLTGLNPGNGTGNPIALGYPAGSFIGPWTIAPPASGYDAYVYEPSGLSMIQNDAQYPYIFFYAKISGIYVISFTCWASGGNSSIAFMGGGIVYSYAIGTTPGGNCTTFMAPLTAGVGYLFIAGGQGAGGGPFNLFTGTQAQFYLLCPS